MHSRPASTRHAEGVHGDPVERVRLAPSQFEQFERRFTASFIAEGITQRADQIRVTPEPWILEADEWFHVRQCVMQRAKLLSSFTEDIRSMGQPNQGQRVIAALPGQLLDAVLRAPEAALLIDTTERPPSQRPVVMYSVDIVRRGGGISLVRDHLDRPLGLGATLLVRSILGRQFADEMTGLAVTPHTEYLTRLRETLADLAPPGRRAPRTIVLAPRSGAVGHVETAFLATRLGHHLASAADLVVLKDRVWLRTLSGTEAVDVVLRAKLGEETDPLMGVPQTSAGPKFGIAGLHTTWRHGGVGLANQLGLRCIEELSSDPTLAGLLDEHLEDLADQPLRLRKSLDPNNAEEGLLRIHTVISGNQIHVLPGGLLTTTVGGVRHLQDVWVRTGTPNRSSAKGRAEVPVDLFESVPTSAAEGLFWAGRHAEQAEVTARVLRMLLRHASDAEAGVLDGLFSLAKAVTDHGSNEGDSARDDQPQLIAPTVSERINEATQTLWLRDGGSVVESVMELNRNLQTARPFVSSSTWTVLNELNMVVGLVADHRAELTPSGESPKDTFDFVEQSDRVLLNLAALGGLIEESTVRSPARTFLLVGRRLQRMHRLLSALSVVLAANLDDAQRPHPPAGLLEGFLNAWESLITYRRRYRSDMQLDQVLRLLVADDSNPRSLAFQAERLSRLIDELPRHPAHEPHQRKLSSLRERTGDHLAWGRDPLGSLHEVSAMTAELTESIDDEWFSLDRMRGTGVLGSSLWG